MTIIRIIFMLMILGVIFSVTLISCSKDGIIGSKATPEESKGIGLIDVRHAQDMQLPCNENNPSNNPPPVDWDAKLIKTPYLFSKTVDRKDLDKAVFITLRYPLDAKLEATLQLEISPGTFTQPKDIDIFYNLPHNFQKVKACRGMTWEKMHPRPFAVMVAKFDDPKEDLTIRTFACYYHTGTETQRLNFNIISIDGKQSARVVLVSKLQSSER